MSTSSIGLLPNQASGTSDSTSNFAQMKAAWQQLAQSLQSGDLDDAKSAFATIMQLQQQMQGTKSSSASQQSSQFDKDMQALGQALQSGDLQSAQTDFAAVQKDMKAMHGHRHHGGGESVQETSNSSMTASELAQLLGATGGSSNTPSNVSVSTYA